MIPDQFILNGALTVDETILLSLLLRFRNGSSVKIRQKGLAQVLGKREQNVSRLFASLKKKGFIKGSRGRYDVSQTLDELDGDKTKLTRGIRKTNHNDKSITRNPLEIQEVTEISHSTGIGTAFLNTLFGDAFSSDELQRGFLNIWARKRSGSTKSDWLTLGELEQAGQISSKYASEGFDVYFGLGLRVNKQTGVQRGGSKDVLAIPGLWLDIDIKSNVHASDQLPSDADEAKELLRAFPLEPSLLVSSGYGLHAYWLFKELWYFENDIKRDKTTSLLRSFQKNFISIAHSSGFHLDNTANLSQLLRIPGTLNWKDEQQPKDVEICSDNSQIRYNPVDFEEWLSPITSGAEQRSSKTGIRAIKLEGVAEGSRNNSAAKIAGYYLGRGFTEEQTLQLLVEWNEKNKPPLSHEELRQVVRSISRKETSKRRQSRYLPSYRELPTSQVCNILMSQSRQEGQHNRDHQT